MSNQNKMSKEYFWGDVLSGNKKEIDWNPSLDDEDEFDNPDGDGIQHFLFLKQAVLGPTAEGDERNVVEIKTENFDGDDVTQPLFSLKLGLNESCPLDIGVQPPVTFILSRGAGPVYLSGQHMIEISADDDDEDLEEEEEDDVDVQASPDLLLSKNKKRPLSTSEGSKKTKMAKLDKDAVEEEQDEDDEDEEDADMAEMDDDDDDEEDEDFKGDEDEDEEDSDEDEEGEEEDDDEDEEEEEDEESPEKPVKKTKGKKSQMNGTATAKGDNKPKVKGQTKVPKAKGKKKMLGIDEIKEKIQASSNVPKKEEKFKNYLRSSFHVSEPKKLQDLWGWYRGSLQK